MGRIPQGTIDQILDRLDIVEVVSDYIQLKKAGQNFKACCPFHGEKTPSFTVSPAKQIYHCFGCGAGGNSIGFVMEHEKMSFPEAVRMLADRAGVEVPEYDNGNSETSALISKLYEVNSIAASFYQNNLWSEKGKKVLEYLKKRGFTDETLKEFRVGYAPDGWEGLKNYCSSKKISPALLRQAGLTIQSSKGKGDYDRFRNRITFPIFNERGSVAAFGARVLDDSLPKYVNSPETTIYNKSGILFGLNFSKKSIREKGFVLVVEGYMDVIIPFQHGITNVVAASGTALTSRQAMILKKCTDTAVMVFDSDQAGEAASLRGMDILVANGMNVRIASLPEGEDPDSMIRKNGVEAFKEFISNAKDLFDYKADLLIKKNGIKNIRDKSKIINEMFPTISLVNDEVIKSEYLTKLAEKLKVHEDSLREEMKKVKPDYSYKYETEKTVSSGPVKHINSELYLLGLSISDKRLFDIVRDELGFSMFRDESAKRVFTVIEGLYGNKDSITPGVVLSYVEGDNAAKSAIMQAIARVDITEDEDRERVLSDCIQSIKKMRKSEALKDLKIQIKKAQETNNDTTELILRVNKLHKDIL